MGRRDGCRIAKDHSVRQPFSDHVESVVFQAGSIRPTFFRQVGGKVFLSD